MFNSSTSRDPHGLTNASPDQTMGNAGQLDPTWSHTYSNDFDTFAAGDWTITAVGTGTNALAAGLGGQLLSTTSIGIADSLSLQLVAAGFQLTPGKPVYFKFQGQLSDVINDVFYAGLIAKSATPLTAADGLYFLKATGQAGIVLQSIIGGVTTSTPIPTPAILVAGVQFELGIEVDYLGNVAAYFNPTTGDVSINAAANQGRGRVASLQGAALTQVLLTPTFGLVNSTAVARSLSTDYIVAVNNR